jgi:hypothetical protein
MDVTNQHGERIALFRGRAYADQGPAGSRCDGGRIARLETNARQATRPGELEPIERASRDEMRALQLQRLQLDAAARLRQRPHYRRRSTRRACTRPT